MRWAPAGRMSATSASAANAKVNRAIRRRVMGIPPVRFRPRLVARMARSVIRGQPIPDYAEFIIGPAEGRPRWLHPATDPSYGSRRSSFQPLGGVLDDAEVGKLADVEARLDETEIAGEVDIPL